ncbi:MAG: bifunctional pyr operon transcriptional regulator/uracil phosphoribosyltransferase PyrR [Burkholderiaceae bacterium]|nr:bifunctional pyr operon transcriptional regulator/uracil phosphoribosyltransferase PyrR [Burkholderiaceae bacterium]MCD8517844.1 bifunctional pyr operon transcriptional regulator/uracil phosphoribosyltransferase PyrR [Burkholderiaceae bacterium]MCD8535972.1 bifunctional pyr operon transcriptional regulator/uracil phosphoribosyltransferase PyrR [Burkholderiaceae bacterium]MCD8564616.1 bifunctional pyr operon transcriptional regulator/uracil phosphoribosyltransferase PyrR [Burkholderiaceae bact
MTPPVDSTNGLPAAEDLYQALRHGVAELIKNLPPDDVHLVGIHSGGAWLAQRLHRDLGLPTALGTLNISFYRDDFDRIGLHPQVEPSDISFDVVGRHLVVVDDVLYTGRTIRGAMNELFDYGRPASIKLVVLIDRGQRELPICADFAAWRFDGPAANNLVLAQTKSGEFTLHVESKEA